MSELSAYLPIVFAQDANGGSFWSTVRHAGADPAACSTFCSSGRSSKPSRSARSMLDTLKKNDKVLTTGGIYATVVSIDARA